MVQNISYVELQNYLYKFKIFEPFGHEIFDLGAYVNNGRLFLYYESKLDYELIKDTQSYYVSFFDLLFKYRAYTIDYTLQNFTMDCTELINNLIEKYTKDHL